MNRKKLVRRGLRRLFRELPETEREEASCAFPLHARLRSQREGEAGQKPSREDPGRKASNTGNG